MQSVIQVQLAEAREPGAGEVSSRRNGDSEGVRGFVSFVFRFQTIKKVGFYPIVD